MTLHYADPWLTVYAGDCREAMAAMAPDSVHCVVTSPPYWGLRDYGTATWEGGEEGCDHALPRRRTYGPEDAKEAIVPGVRPGDPGNRLCGRCGARRIDAQLGLEPTPEEYVADMVAVFREVRRVLRSDGTVWLNLGDSYAAGGGSGPQRLDELGERLGTGGGHNHSSRPSGRAPSAGLAQKQLVGIPWRVAFALQADGWYLRSDIIWAKPNPMPESVTDRPTKAHEYVFLLTKSARYYWDADAVREPHVRIWDPAAPNGSINARTRDATGIEPNPAGRNLRSVWTIATEPYPGAHFATFPQKLVEPCIKAGTSERGVCPECGAPWIREVERGELVRDDGSAVRLVNPVKRDGSLSAWSRPGGKVETVVPNSHRQTTTTGWRPSCEHRDRDWTPDGYAPSYLTPVPATVLDPFAGSGTVGRVAQRLSRRAVLIDLNPEYLMQAMERNRDIPLGLESA